MNTNPSFAVGTKVKFKDVGNLSPRPLLEKEYEIIRYFGSDANGVILDDHPWKAPLGVPVYIPTTLLSSAS